MKRRKYLTVHEVERLISAVATTKNSERNKCMLLMCFIHGLRVSELSQLKLRDVEISNKIIYISRLKNGFSVQHPLQHRELVALKAWMQKRSGYLGSESEYLFLSRHGKKISRQQLYRIFREAGQAANINIDVHPHMFRHACGYALADKGCDTRLIQDYLGHRNIQNTVIYTASNAARFKSVVF
ncbi:tyrosine-type DNA invertase [Enterobacter sp. UNJFSC 003]|uniref:tyrosine-type DNA invertase n=1 Tax=Enterobacter sp. UNJFSC 003 TaxID=3122077 RepID=UPI002EC28054|nr:tyrosine-type DNA invertase [Serratia liquefaciens]